MKGKTENDSNQQRDNNCEVSNATTAVMEQ